MLTNMNKPATDLSTCLLENYTIQDTHRLLPPFPSPLILPLIPPPIQVTHRIFSFLPIFADLQLWSSMEKQWIRWTHAHGTFARKNKRGVSQHPSTEDKWAFFKVLTRESSQYPHKIIFSTKRKRICICKLSFLNIV